MNKKERFTKAHEITRNLKKEDNSLDYRATFGMVLRALAKGYQGEKIMNEIERKKELLKKYFNVKEKLGYFEDDTEEEIKEEIENGIKYGAYESLISKIDRVNQIIKAGMPECIAPDYLSFTGIDNLITLNGRVIDLNNLNI